MQHVGFCGFAGCGRLIKGIAGEALVDLLNKWSHCGAYIAEF